MCVLLRTPKITTTITVTIMTVKSASLRTHTALSHSEYAQMRDIIIAVVVMVIVMVIVMVTAHTHLL